MAVASSAQRNSVIDVTPWLYAVAKNVHESEYARGWMLYEMFMSLNISGLYLLNEWFDAASKAEIGFPLYFDPVDRTIEIDDDWNVFFVYNSKVRTGPIVAVKSPDSEVTIDGVTLTISREYLI